jgi:hypothetical protein
MYGWRSFNKIVFFLGLIFAAMNIFQAIYTCILKYVYFPISNNNVWFQYYNPLLDYIKRLV